MSQLNIFTANNNYEQEKANDEGLISKAGNAISSFFSAIKNSINPFKRQTFTQNPYDLNSSNDPFHHLNSIPNSNQNNSFMSSYRQDYSNNYQQDSVDNKRSQIYYTNNMNLRSFIIY